MLKILQVGFHLYVNWELSNIQAGFGKGRGNRDQVVNIPWIAEKAKEFQENIYFCFIDCANALDCVITEIYGKFFKRWEYQTT